MIRSIFGKLIISHLAVISLAFNNILTVLINVVFMHYFVHNHIVESKRRELIFKGNAVISLLSAQKPTDFLFTSLGEIIGASAWITLKDGTYIAGKPPEYWSQKSTPTPKTSPKPSAAVRNPGLAHADRQTRQLSLQHRCRTFLSLPHYFFGRTNYGGKQDSRRSRRSPPALPGNRIISLSILRLYYCKKPYQAACRHQQCSLQGFSHGGDFNSRTKVTGNDEIGHLGTTFSNMAEALAHIDQNRRGFLANVTHELKTPVTCIRALIEAIIDGVDCIS